ncbi:MAG: endonuclease/exonuclease/phosphatase family protein [Granulosicoccus sp.]
MQKLLSKRGISQLVNCACLISLTAAFSEHALVFDLVSHFRVQYLLGFIPLFGIALYLSAWVPAGLLGVSIAMHAMAVIPAWLPVAFQDANAAPANALRLMSANVQGSNKNHEAMIRYIRQVDPHVLIVPEMTQKWQHVLMQQLPQFPYYSGRMQHDYFGIGVFSKQPFESQLLPIFDREHIPSVQVQIRWGEDPITLIGTHPPPPVNTGMYQSRNRHLQAMAEHVVLLNGPVVVAGDLNITPWSGHFHRLLSESQLGDSRDGFGLQLSWPSVSILPALMPIDHILVSNNIRVLDRQTSPAIGSDHRAVWADIVIID